MKLAKALSDRTGGLSFDGENPRLGDYLRHWLTDSVRDSVRTATYDGYDRQVRNHISPALGQIKLEALSPARLRAMYRKKLDSGLWPRTAQYVHVTLRKALKQAVDDGLVPRNVAEAVRPPQLRREEIEPLTLDQTKALVEAARGDRLEALYVVAKSTGLRQGELLGLKWEDVDPDRGVLRVRRTLTASKGGRPAFGAPKTDKGKRSVRTPGAPVEALERHHTLQLEEREKLAERWQDHGLVFCTGVLCSSSYRLGQYCSGPESVGQHHSDRHSATSGYHRRFAISCTAWQSTMLASPDC